MTFRRVLGFSLVLLTLSVLAAQPAFGSSNHTNPPGWAQFRENPNILAEPKPHGAKPITAIADLVYAGSPTFVAVDYPKHVKVGDPFSISITVTSHDEPEWSLICYVAKLASPAGVQPPALWQETAVSPWAPEDNGTASGAVEPFADYQAMQAAWPSWYGVGTAPYDTGAITVLCGQVWRMGHYTPCFYGDSVTQVLGGFKATTAGAQTFTLMLDTFIYVDYTGTEYWGGQLQPISFTVKATGQ